MEKYKALIGNIELLEEYIAHIRTSTNRKEIEELDLKAKKLINLMSVRCAYVYKDVHSLAQKRAGEVLVQDTRTNIEE